MRFRPNLLTLEGRDVPAVLMVGSDASPVAIHAQRDADITVENDDAGLNNTGQSAAEPDALHALIGGKGALMSVDGRTGAELQSFLAFPGVYGPVRGAGVGDGDGFSDLIVGSGPGYNVDGKIEDVVIVAGGVNGHVKVFDGATGAEIRSFFPGG